MQHNTPRIQVDKYVLISKKGFTSELTDYSKQSEDAILWGGDVMTER